MQNFRVKDDIAMRHRDEPSVFEMLRTIATARLMLGAEMNIQAPPNLTPDAHGMYLLAGINDWGGISPVTKDHINPERPWPNLLELKETCADAGFELRERLGALPGVRARGRGYEGFVPDAHPRADRAAGGRRRAGEAGGRAMVSDRSTLTANERQAWQQLASDSRDDDRRHASATARTAR